MGGFAVCRGFLRETGRVGKKSHDMVKQAMEKMSDGAEPEQ